MVGGSEGLGKPDAVPANLGAGGLWGASSPPLAGVAEVGGDKSISHRALIFAALAVGISRFEGLAQGEDVRATARALTALGARIRTSLKTSPEASLVEGQGLMGWRSPEGVLDLGNAGTAARLLAGALAMQPLRATLTGDASLCARPMARVLVPLRKMGARFLAQEGDRLPLTMEGASALRPWSIPRGVAGGRVWVIPVASAQVKTALVLAGLIRDGAACVREPAPSRDHTERMAPSFGVKVATRALPDGGHEARFRLEGGAMRACAGRIPADPSSAAFVLAAAVLTGGRASVRGVALNPGRLGFVAAMRAMGVEVRIEEHGTSLGEPMGDITCAAPREGLRAAVVPASQAPSLIDEAPILAVLAARARGETRLEGLGELRVKESDRMKAMTEGLCLAGVEACAQGDALVVRSDGAAPAGGCVIAAGLDHRVAMAFAVLGLASRAPIGVRHGARAARSSFPAFVRVMRALGARIATT